MFLTDGDGFKKTPISLPKNKDCHFLHNSEEMSAALSNCGEKNNTYMGHIIHEGKILEIKPLHDRFQTILEMDQVTNLHIITRRPINELPEFDTEIPLKLIKEKSTNKSDVGQINKRGGGTDPLTIETAVFLDPTAYR